MSTTSTAETATSSSSITRRANINYSNSCSNNINSSTSNNSSNSNSDNNSNNNIINNSISNIISRMPCQQFLLDLSGNSAIPSHYKIGMTEVVKWIHIQTKGYSDIQVTSHFNRGCFLIQTANDQTAKFLSTLNLGIKVNGQGHHVALRRELPGSTRLRVKFSLTGKGDIGLVPNKYFDDVLEAAGFTLDEPTFKTTHKDTTVYDGNRIAYVIRGKNHIDRNHEWISDEGKVFKWRLEYDGQPFYCFRGCNILHENGNCPKWEKIKERRANEGQQKVYIASSSVFRLAEDTKTTQVVAIPGAKIGHVANHINNDTNMFQKAEVLIVAAGANMDRGTVESSKPFVEDQALELTKVLKPMVDTKKIFVVDPVVGPLNKSDSAGDHWAMVRQQMRKVANKCKATWVSLEGVDWKPEEDVGDDHVHYTTAGTAKVLKAVGAKVKEVSGIDMLDGMEVQEKPYAAIYNRHYKFGCYRCTRVHERGPCPELNTPVSSPKSSSNNSATNTSPANSSNNNTFHTVTDGNNSSLNSEGDLIIASPGWTPEANSSVAAGRASRSVTTPSSTPISAAVAAATAAAEISLASRLMGDNHTPSDPRSRSNSNSSKRQRDPLDTSQDQAVEKKKQTQGQSKPSKGSIPVANSSKSVKK